MMGKIGGMATEALPDSSMEPAHDAVAARQFVHDRLELPGHGRRPRPAAVPSAMSPHGDRRGAVAPLQDGVFHAYLDLAHLRQRGCAACRSGPT